MNNKTHNLTQRLLQTLRYPQISKIKFLVIICVSVLFSLILTIDSHAAISSGTYPFNKSPSAVAKAQNNDMYYAFPSSGTVRGGQGIQDFNIYKWSAATNSFSLVTNINSRIGLDQLNDYYQDICMAIDTSGNLNIAIIETGSINSGGWYSYARGVYFGSYNVNSNSWTSGFTGLDTQALPASVSVAHNYFSTPKIQVNSSGDVSIAYVRYNSGASTDNHIIVKDGSNSNTTWSTSDLDLGTQGGISDFLCDSTGKMSVVYSTNASIGSNIYVASYPYSNGIQILDGNVAGYMTYGAVIDSTDKIHILYGDYVNGGCGIASNTGSGGSWETASIGDSLDYLPYEIQSKISDLYIDTNDHMYFVANSFDPVNYIATGYYLFGNFEGTWKKGYTNISQLNSLTSNSCDFLYPLLDSSGNIVVKYFDGSQNYISGYVSGILTDFFSTSLTRVTAIGSISGTAQVSSTLTAGALTPSAATVSYQWKISSDGTTYTNISGATSSTYTPVSGDAGKYIEVMVTGKGSYFGIVTSSPTAQVAASTTPVTGIGSISGTAQVNSTLTAGALTPSAATVSYQWKISTDGTTYTNISGATSSTYTPVSGDAGKYIEVVVTGTGSYSGTVTSSPTAQVAASTTPVTGIGSISGTAQVNSTLTAGALTPSAATVSYQWKISSDGTTYTNISGATSSTYTPVSGDVGKYIEVVVTGTGSYSGTVTSSPTAQVAAAPIAVTAIGSISGTAQVNSTLTAGALTPSAATVSYQWKISSDGTTYTNISGATSSTYTPVSGDVGKYIEVVVTGTGSYSGTVTSSPTAQVAAASTAVTAIGSISGTAQVNSTLTAGALTPSAATVSYQWKISSDGTTYTNISGATSSTYTPVSGDVGKYIEVVVTGTGSYSGTVTSSATAQVAASTTPVTGIGSISGTAQVNSTLTAGALTPLAATVRYQWKISSDGTTYTDISGATSNTYTPVSGDVGKYIEVVVTGTGSYSGTVTSSPTSQVTAASTAVTAIGSISGTAQVGSTLTAGELTPSAATVSYQWKISSDGTTYTNISGATSSTYTPVSGDVGKYIEVVVTGTGSYSGTVTSSPTSQVTAASTAVTAIGSISGTAQVNSTLTAGALTPSAATVSYQWKISSDGTTYTNISGATSSTYTPVSGDAGKYIEVVVTGTGSYSGTLTSSPTSQVAAAATPVTGIGSISGTAQVNSTLTAGALIPSAATVSYQWKISTDGTTYTDISGATSSTYTPVSGDAGKYIEVVVTGTGSYSGTVTSSATAQVAAAPISLTMVTAALPDGTVGNVYNFTLSVSNGDAPYTFNVTAGSLPGGIVLSPDGTLSGMPLTSGIYNFTILVTDELTHTISRPFTLNIGIATNTNNNSRDKDTATKPSTTTTNTQSQTQQQSSSTPTTPTTTPAQNVTNDESKIPTIVANTVQNTESTTVAPVTTTTIVKPTLTSISTAINSLPVTPIFVDTYINTNKQIDLATGSTTIVDNKSLSQVIIDPEKLNQRLSEIETGSVVIVPVNVKSDVISTQLEGQSVQNMVQKQAAINIQTPQASYTIPSKEFNMEEIAHQLGQGITPSDIKINIAITKSSQDVIKQAQAIADKNSSTIVVPPVQFDVVCSSGTNKLNIENFTAYVERTIEIPEGIDPTKITTAVVLNKDGTETHIPTHVTIVNGKFYAQVNSLTNSTYMLVWHPVMPKDSQKSWAKKYINDAASRMIIDPIKDNAFNPNGTITRAEFIEALVKGLGLKRSGEATTIFKDVYPNSKYMSAISVAVQRGIIVPGKDGIFNPSGTLTKQDAMVFMANALKVVGLNSEIKDNEAIKIIAGFKDGKDVNKSLTNYAALCIREGVTDVYTNKTIMPQLKLTRAQAAVMIIKLLAKAKLI